MFDSRESIVLGRRLWDSILIRAIAILQCQRHRWSSPGGRRVAFAARGEVLTSPREHGDVRDLTRSPGAHDKHAAFSPDGAFLLAGIADGSLAAWRDASGSRGARFPSRLREPARDETAFAVALLEARVTLGARTLLAPPPDPAAAAAAERRGGAVGVDAACVASADASAREDAEAFLPRIDTPAIAGLVLRVNSGASGDDFARKTLHAKNADPAAVSCAICGAPAWFSVADGPDATARAVRERRCPEPLCLRTCRHRPAAGTPCRARN